MGLRSSAASMSCSGVRSQESGVGADFLTAGSRLQPPAQGSYQSTKHLGNGVARIQESALIVLSDVFQPSRDLYLGFDLAQRSDRNREVAQVITGPRSPVSLRNIRRHGNGCAP